MATYKQLSKDIEHRMVQEKLFMGTPNEDAIRRNPDRDKNTVLRPAYVRDIEKIIHSPFYNRYADKTQVFSFYRNDDISRRALHVQLVSRIARNIGRMLGLNLDLIEAMALGHDIGHTPFGHAGERILSQLLFDHVGRRFNHNVHSVRVLDQMIARNISLQTLDGVLCHNGELEQQEYRPCILHGFEEFDKKVEECYTNEQSIGKLVPSTLEACVMRICDIIAYLGKDRQDAARLGMLGENIAFSNGQIGSSNSEIINNLVVNIIEKSYGKPYLQMDQEYFAELVKAKKENSQLIYGNADIHDIYEDNIRPMFTSIYYKLLEDAKDHNKNSLLYRHHVEFVKENNRYQIGGEPYEETEPNQMVVDYIASMTDDYFIDLYKELFPDGNYAVKYVGYFKK